MLFQKPKQFDASLNEETLRKTSAQSPDHKDIILFGVEGAGVKESHKSSLTVIRRLNERVCRGHYIPNIFLGF